jgi:hypothetical protein
LFVVLFVYHISLFINNSSLFVNNSSLFVNNSSLFVGSNSGFGGFALLSSHMSSLYFLTLQHFINFFNLSINKKGFRQMQLGYFFLDLGVNAVGGGFLAIVSFVLHRD